MRKRLYRFHNLPIYFSLDPRRVEAYNRFYEGIQMIPSTSTLEDYEHALDIWDETHPSIEQAYRAGIIPQDLKLDTSVPLEPVNYGNELERD